MTPEDLKAKMESQWAKPGVADAAAFVEWDFTKDGHLKMVGSIPPMAQKPSAKDDDDDDPRLSEATDHEIEDEFHARGLQEDDRYDEGFEDGQRKNPPDYEPEFYEAIEHANRRKWVDALLWLSRSHDGMKPFYELAQQMDERTK